VAGISANLQHNCQANCIAALSVTLHKYLIVRFIIRLQFFVPEFLSVPLENITLQLYFLIHLERGTVVRK
jgi:hypothetical protein